MLQVIKRHGSGVRFFSDDNMLSETTHQFSSLRRQLRTSHENISLSMCLAPFRSLFRLTDCSSAILASALGSVAKLLRSGIFGLFREDEAILEFRRLIMIIAECRLDGGELSGDETALQRLLDVLLLAMKSSSLSVCFGDAEVCKIIETCFSVCVLPRVGELFRRHAELCCLQLSGILLGRVRELATAQAMPLMGVLKIAYPGTRADDPEPLPPALAALEAELEREKKEKEKEKEEGTIPLTDEPTSLAPPPTTTPTSPISSIGDDGASVMVDSPIEVVTPYSMAAIMEFLSHLLRLLEVGEARNTDRMRSLCLAILSDFVERNYDFLPDCSLLWDFIYAQLDRVLIQLLLLESPSLQVHLHQTILSVFGRFRRRLIAPTELLISTLIGLLQQRPAPGKQPRIAREYYLDMMSFFCLDGDFLADIYVLYECGRKFGDTLEDFIGALVNIVQLDPKQVTGQDYFLALEIIIQILQALDAAGTLSECTPDPEKLRADRNLKLLMRRSAELFNEDPKEAFTFLAEHGLTSSPPTPQEIAQYLRRTPGLDKKAIGEIVAKPSNVELLKEFLADFHFAGLRIDEALRVVLESFRLPGEAQQISRIMESLAQLYYRSHTGEVFKNEDAVFVLAYSIVMLNTDQHNKQVRHKMSVEEFIRNNRGTNDGADFEQSFIRRIYHAIQSKEIVMPEEQAGEMAFHYTWNEQLKKQSSTAEPPHLALDGYAPDIMRLLWRPFLGCFRTCTLYPDV